MPVPFTIRPLRGGSLRRYRDWTCATRSMPRRAKRALTRGRTRRVVFATIPQREQQVAFTSNSGRGTFSPSQPGHRQPAAAVNIVSNLGRTQSRPALEPGAGIPDKSFLATPWLRNILHPSSCRGGRQTCFATCIGYEPLSAQEKAELENSASSTAR